MTKIIKSITIDKEIASQGVAQADKERRSFSSFVENLIHAYLIKKKKR